MKVSRRNFIKAGAVSIPVLTACANKGNLDDLEFTKKDPIPPLENFSFFQLSDTHISPFFDVPDSLSGARSYTAMQKIKAVKKIKVNDQLTTPEPDFYLHTGDLAEYGFPGETVKVVDEYLKGIEKPFYWIAGNHDHTWVPNTKLLEDEYGGTSYFFDHKGIRFIGINSATLQEPLPSFSKEAVNFLKETLARTDPAMPLIVFWHHPWNETYFISEFDMDRVLDLLRPYNVLVVLLGHYHFGRHDQYGGLDFCIGNAPFVKSSPDDYEGFSVVDIQEGIMRVIDVDANDTSKTRVLLEKAVNRKPNYPNVEIQKPEPEEIISEDQIVAASVLSRIGDFGTKYKLDGNEISEPIDLSDTVNGTHSIKAIYSNAEETFEKSHQFFINKNHPQSPQMIWKTELEASCQATPLVHKNNIHVGDNNGNFYTIEAASGSAAEKVKKPGAILRQATIGKDKCVYTTSRGLIQIRGLGTGTSKQVEIKNAIHFTPVISQFDIAYFGDLESSIYAIDLNTKEMLWQNDELTYSVESRPAIIGNQVIFNCWDGYVHSFHTGTGEKLWSAPGPRNQERNVPSRYYGPADTAPFVWNDELYVVDRGYNLGKFDLEGNFKGVIQTGVAAASVSSSGDKLICRITEEPMRAIDSNGQVIWASDTVLGRNPIEPTCADGLIYAASNDGMLHCFSEKTGYKIWSYSVTPRLSMFGGVALSEQGDKVFAVGMDGVMHGINTRL